MPVELSIVLVLIAFAVGIASGLGLTRRTVNQKGTGRLARGHRRAETKQVELAKLRRHLAERKSTPKIR